MNQIELFNDTVTKYTAQRDWSRQCDRAARYSQVEGIFGELKWFRRTFETGVFVTRESVEQWRGKSQHVNKIVTRLKERPGVGRLGKVKLDRDRRVLIPWALLRYVYTGS